VDRRHFLLTSLAGALPVPLTADGQEPRKVWRIGLFHVGLDHVPPFLEGLRAGLRALDMRRARMSAWTGGICPMKMLRGTPPASLLGIASMSSSRSKTKRFGPLRVRLRSCPSSSSM